VTVAPYNGLLPTKIHNEKPLLVLADASTKLGFGYRKGHLGFWAFHRMGC
jgi:hypothetical protein